MTDTEGSYYWAKIRETSKWCIGYAHYYENEWYLFFTDGYYIPIKDLFRIITDSIPPPKNE